MIKIKSFYIICYEILFSYNLYDLLIFFFHIALIALSTAIKATPTSANTASHILDAPNAVATKTITFTPNANIIFCHTILLVFLDIAIAFAIWLG